MYSFQTNPSGFGGMKKGFLFGGSNTSKSKPVTKPATSKSKDSLPKSTDDIPLLKPKQSKQEERRIPEVQEAMMSDFMEKNKGQRAGSTEFLAYHHATLVMCCYWYCSY